MQSIGQFSLHPTPNPNRHLKAEQEFCSVMDCLGLNSPKPLGYPSPLGCDLPYLQIVFRMGILVSRVSVELSYLASGHRLDSSRWSPKPHLRRPAFGMKIRNS
jgi:hypothetical protein